MANNIRNLYEGKSSNVKCGERMGLILVCVIFLGSDSCVYCCVIYSFFIKTVLLLKVSELA